MVLISPADRGDIDLGGLASKLGGIDAGLHLKFLQGVDRRQEGVAAVVDVGVGDAIQSKVIPLLPLPADGYLRNCGTIATLTRGRPVGAEAGNDVRAQSYQRSEVAPIERQIDDALIVNHSAHSCV